MAHLQCRRELGQVVDVHLRQPHCALRRHHQLLERRRELLARLAPVCVKIHDHRPTYRRVL